MGGCLPRDPLCAIRFRLLARCLRGGHTRKAKPDPGNRPEIAELQRGNHRRSLHHGCQDQAGGEVATWTENGLTWVRGPLASTPPWWHEKLASSNEVDRLTGPLSSAQDATQLWAWQDEAAGVVRASGVRKPLRRGRGRGVRFVLHAAHLPAALGRRLTIHHGRGSIVHAQPGPPATAEISRSVTSDGPASPPGRSSWSRSARPPNPCCTRALQLPLLVGTVFAERRSADLGSGRRC